MALGLSLSTLGNLGRVASRGVEQHAQRRQEDAERELTKDMLTASVKGDYDELVGKLRQGFYGDVRPELLNVASQTVSQGLQIKRKEKREKASDIYDITKHIYSTRGGKITMEEAGQLAHEQYNKSMGTPGYTPKPPTGKTLIEQGFEALSKLRGEELETKKKELAKDIREAHYNESITPNDYEKYMRQLQGHGRGVAFGLGRVGSDIFQGVADLMPRRFVPTPVGFAGALAGGVVKKTLGSAYEGLTAPRIQAPQR